MGGSVGDLLNDLKRDPIGTIVDRSPTRRLLEGIGNTISGGGSGDGPVNSLLEQDYLRKKREQEAKKAAEDAAKEQELAPLKKALRDEVNFMGQKYALGSKIGGRGLF